MASAETLTGVIPYLASPTDAAGKIDRRALRALTQHLVGQGVHGLAPLGSTGEFAYLGRAERAAVVEAYFPVSEAGVEAYFTAIADAAEAPVTIYTNPNFQRADLSLPVIERLSHHPNIRYLKDASTNTGRLLSVINRCGDRLGVFAASSHITAAVVLIGGLGWMAGPSCVAPRASVTLYEHCRAGRWEEAMALQRRLWALNEAFARFNLAAAIKAGLRLQGFDCGDPLPPQAALGPDEIAVVRAALEAVDAL